MANLSPNFTIDEFTRSLTARRRGINNPFENKQQESNAKLLCMAYLEPLRAAARLINPKAVIKITSGFRSQALNAAIGGSRTSEHMQGLAVDFEIPGLELFDAFVLTLRTLKNRNLSWSQIIYEEAKGLNPWIHLGIGSKGQKQILHKMPNTKSYAVASSLLQKARKETGF